MFGGEYMGMDVDNLEIQVEAKAKEATSTLDALEEKLKSIASTLERVNKQIPGLGGMSNVNSASVSDLSKSVSSVDKAVRKVNSAKIKPRVDRADLKYTEKDLGKLFSKFKDVGKNLDLSGLNYSELTKGAASAGNEVERLNARLQKKLATENVANYGKAYVNLVYDIQKARNAQKSYTDALEKYNAASRRTIHIYGAQNVNTSGTDIDAAVSGAAAGIGDVSIPKFSGTKEVGDYLVDIERKEKSLQETARQTPDGSEFDGIIQKLARLSVESKKASQAYSDLLAANKSSTPSTGNAALATATASGSAPKTLSYEARIKELKASLSGLSGKGLGQGDAEYDRMAQKLANVTERLKRYKAELRSVAKVRYWEDTATPIDRVKKALKEVCSQNEKFNSVAKKARKTVSGLSSSLKKISGICSKPIAALKRLGTAIKGVREQSKQRMTWGKMVASSILFSTVFGAISTIKNAIAEGSDNLVQYSEAYNNSISSIVSSLNFLKNAWAAAFAPIVNVVAPYLSAFIDMMATALNKLAQLFSALTGKKFAVQAKKTWTDYAASVSDAASGLSDAADAAKDFQTYTLGIDELNVQPQQSSTSGSGSSGSGGGSGTGTDVSDMFETVKVSDKISKLAQEIKDAWEKADFTDIGAKLGTKLLDGLNSIPWTKIQKTASKVGKSFATLINGIVSVPNLGTTLGKTVGQGINTGVGLINSFLDNTKWDAVGKFIGSGLNGLVNTIKWDSIGHMFAQKWNAVLTTLYNAGKKFDAKKLGGNIATAINTFFADFNFDTLAETLNTWVDNLEDFIAGFFGKLSWSDIGKGLKDFFGNLELDTVTVVIGAVAWKLGAAGAVLSGLQKVLLPVIKNLKLVSSINIGSAFSTAATALSGMVTSFGAIAKIKIASTFTKVSTAVSGAVGTLGTFAQTGLTVFAQIAPTLAGVAAVVGGLYAAFSSFFAMMNNGFSPIKSAIMGVGIAITAIGAVVLGVSATVAAPIALIVAAFANAAVLIKQHWGAISKFFSGIWTTVSGVFSDAKSGAIAIFSSVFTGAYNKVTGAFSAIGTWASERWQLVTGVFGSVKDGVVTFFTQKFKAAYSALTTAFSAIGTWASGRWQKVTEIFGDATSGVVGFFTSKFTGAYSAIVTAFTAIGGWASGVLTTISNKFNDAKDGAEQIFKDAFGKAYKAVSNAFKNIGRKFAEIGNKIIKPIKDAVNAVISGVNWVIEKLGGSDRYAPWEGVTLSEGSYKTGSSGLPKDTIGVVNDQTGPVYRELIVPPKGKPFIPEGRNVTLPMQKGTKIMPARQTQALMAGAPKFAGGIGDLFGDAWAKISDFAGDILDYLSNPKAITQMAIDKFYSVTGAIKAATKIIKAAMSAVFDVARAKVESLFDSVAETENKDGIGKISMSDLIPAYTGGGFPEDGLFLANHNELIGQFSDGRTAVANNEDIQSGIMRGVRSAIYEAVLPYLKDIADSARETADKDLTVNIGDREIYLANKRGAKRTGYSFT